MPTGTPILIPDTQAAQDSFVRMLDRVEREATDIISRKRTEAHEVIDRIADDSEEVLGLEERIADCIRWIKDERGRLAMVASHRAKL